MSGSGTKYKAKYDFTTTQSGTLTFKAGDVFVFLSKSSEDWWSVRTTNGQIGLVPATYLEELKEQGATRENVPVTYKALYDYTGANGSQLTFKQGDVMMLVDMPSSGWWSMRHSVTGKQGLVPTNYVEKVSAGTVGASGPQTTGGSSSSQRTEPNLKDEKALSEVLLSIDRAIEAIHAETTKAGGIVTAQQRAALTRLLQHRQQTIAMSKQEAIAPQQQEQVHVPSAAQVTPPSTSTPALSTSSSSSLSSQPNLQPSGRQSMYVESGDPSDSLDQRQRSSTLPKRQAPPPPKRDERYTLSSPQPDSRGSSPRNSIYGEKVMTSDQSLATETPPITTTTTATITTKTHSGLSLATPGSPLRGRTTPSAQTTGLSEVKRPSSVLSTAPQSKLPTGESKMVGVTSAEDVAAMLSSFCDDLAVSMEAEMKSVDDSIPGSPFRGRTLSNPRSSPSARRHSNPTPTDPVLPPVPGVNESAVAMTTTASHRVATPTSAPAVVGSAAAPLATTSATPTSLPSATPAVTHTTSSPAAPPPPVLRTQFTDQEAAELVEAVRVSTGMNYKNTLIAVNSVLDFMRTKVPECSNMVEGLLRALHSSQTGVAAMGNDQLVSKDMERLREAFFQIKDCKDDTQQRGWAVHDDHHIISGFLSELLQLLCDADPDISRKVIKEDKYENVLTLIEFYHLEPRVPLRLLMLKIFAALCELDHTVIGILLTSVLPNELGRDIQQGISETEKALYSSTVCTIIFSTGEAVPLSLYDQWNMDYVLFLLDTIEQPPPSDKHEALPDAFMNIILAFNQHFQDPASNTVMSALKERPNPKAFSEKLMLLVNRGEDPVGGHGEPNSLLKIMLDMFSDKATSAIFYTTDLMVLIDIIHRQLSDLEAGSKTRTHYLELLYRVLCTTEYTEHNRRQRELTICLSRIAREDLEESEGDREVVARIRTKFPMLFEESTV